MGCASMRRSNAITLLNNFFSGALTLLIPLFLLDRNADLSQIGAVLPVLPIVFLIVLLFLAAFADRVGWSHIFILVNWPANFFSNFVYYVATALSAFFVAFSSCLLRR